MDESHTRRDPGSPPKPAAEELAAGVGDVVAAALGVGAALAKVVARAASSNNEVPPPPPAYRPVDELLYYSTVAVGGLVRAAVFGFAIVSDAANTRPAAAPVSQPTPVKNVPRVNAGATLRVPLSIENPGPGPMTDLRLTSVEVIAVDVPGTRRNPPPAIRLEPEQVSIEPRDFEKVTVIVATRMRTPPGLYETRIIAEQHSFELSLQFEVLSVRAET